MWGALALLSRAWLRGRLSPGNSIPRMVLDPAAQLELEQDSKNSRCRCAALADQFVDFDWRRSELLHGRGTHAVSLALRIFRSNVEERRCFMRCRIAKRVADNRPQCPQHVFGGFGQ